MFRNVKPTLNLFTPRITSSVPLQDHIKQRITHTNPESLIKHISVDLAGTVVDPCCLAPMHALHDIFAPHEIELSPADITKDMGLPKREHIRRLIRDISMKQPEKCAQLSEETLYRNFIHALEKYLPQFQEITPHSLDILNFLREQNIKITFTSGYPRPLAELAAAKLLKEFKPDAMTFSDEVSSGLRHQMILKNLEKCKLHPTELARTIFYTDSNSDIADVRKINSPWTVGVAGSSTHLQFTNADEAKQCSPHEFNKRLKTATQLLWDSGAHIVIRDMSDALHVLVMVQDLMQNNGCSPSKTQRLPLDYISPEPTPIFTMGARR